MGQVSYFFICCLGKRKLHILRTSVVLSFLSHMAGFGLHHSPYSLLSIFSDVLWKGHKDTFSKSKQELGRKTWGWIYLLDFSHILFQNLKIIITEMSHLVAKLVKNLFAMWETCVWSLDWEEPLKKQRATHSSILAWRIPTVHGITESDTTEQLSLSQWK